MSVQKLDLTVSENIESDAFKILSVLRPSWKEGDVNFKVFTEGITNKLLACRHKDDTTMNDILLVRVYGNNTDLIIDRDLELQNMQLLHMIGCSKPAFARFRNGIVYGFVPGECLDEKSVRDPHIAKLITRELVTIHHVDPEKLAVDHPEMPPVDTNPCLFPKVKKFIDLIPEEYPDPDRNRRFQSEVPSKAELCKELDLMRAEVEKLQSRVVFSHNDLLLKNIVFNKDEDRTYFIDFEYGAFNYQAYDIANHFCEYAGIETVDFNLYPDKDYQLVWLRNYLEFDYKRSGKNPGDVSAVEVERLYVQTCKFALMAHFFWGVWALIQARYSSIDFDYLDYAIVRISEYFKKKDEFLALEMP